MAGYDYCRGRSQNAAAAEDNGLMLAGTIAQEMGRRVKAKHVEQVLHRVEWHHVGAAYQARNYYRWPTPEEAAEIYSLAANEKGVQPNRLIADVQWLEWPSFRPYQTGRRACPTLRQLTGAIVTIKGDYATIEHPSLQKPMRKRLDTNGFAYQVISEKEMQ